MSKVLKKINEMKNTDSSRGIPAQLSQLEAKALMHRHELWAHGWMPVS
jgi:hypothetical protein